MDTTKIEIINKGMDAFISSYTKQSNWFDKSLQGVCIGIVATLLIQLLIFVKTKRKEIEAKKDQLIAEEQSVAYLIQAYVGQKISYEVLSEYFARGMELCDTIKFNSIEHKNEIQLSKEKNQNRHFEYSFKLQESFEKVQVTIAEYIKILTSYVILNRKSLLFARKDSKVELEINKQIENIRIFKTKISCDFKHITAYNDLNEKASKNEALRVITGYNEFWQYFENIKKVME